MKQYGWSVRNRLFGLGLVGVVVSTFIAVQSHFVLNRISEQIHAIEMHAGAMRHHLEADMMHDAVRGDVLSALQATSDGSHDRNAEIEAELAAHIEWFRASLEKEEKAVAGDPNIIAAMELVYPDLNAYVKEAEHIVSLVFSNREEAVRRLDAFDVLYEALEGKMLGLSDLIEEDLKKEEAEGEVLIRSKRDVNIGVLIVAIILMAIAAFYTSRSIINPIKELSQVATSVASGDLTIQSANTSKDEIGELASNFNQMTHNLAGLVSQVKNGTTQISSASEQLSTSSTKMSADSETTDQLVASVSASSDETNNNIQTVSSAASEMSNTIKEISSNIQEATQFTTHAVSMAETTDETISRLGEASTEIGDVIKVITSIAQQTNLLALNATIEAARAGEAGKGFAVVANEVKELAKATSKATDEIGQKITAIQDNTGSAVTAIGEIKQLIKKIDDVSTNIAGAIEEQAVTTDEITRNVSEAAYGTEEVSKNMSGMTEASKSTAEGSGNIMSAAESLSKMGEELIVTVNKFKVDADSRV